MNRILDIGYPLRLGNNEEPFIIKDILGKGASSVTYLAECNQTEHVLKECNPLGLHMHRDDNCVLVPDTELNEKKFKECLERFESGLDKQLAFRMTNTLKNPTSNVQKKHCANGTVYIDMTYFEGCTYDQVEFESLFDVLKRMKALSKIVDGYHKEGYLHLDIKPQNIFAIPETPEMVMMFDFDSIIAEEDVKDENQIFLSYTDAWAAPEQKMAKYRKSICKATDLFAIGEIIFHRAMGRHSCADERFDFSKYAYDRNAKIFENVNPRVFGLLDDLFHKTLCCAPTNRIQTADELIVLLDEIIPLADPQKPFLISNLPTPKEFFIGRDAEIKDIHVKLQQSPVLFLHGIGGIGKSELAKQYAKKYGSEYDTIIFAPFLTDIVSLIASDNCVQINNFSKGIDEKVEEYYARKLRKIKELFSDNSARILFIVDNLDTSEDKNIRLLFELGCRVLITSRTDMGAVFKRPQLEINAISDFLFARELFAYYYHFADAESDDVDAIIKLVQGHTLAIELIAKQIDAEWSTTQKIREKLENGGLSSIGDEVIDNAKDDLATQDSAFGHIKALFDLSIFEKSGRDNELYVLANLSLMPFTGVDCRLFADWCDLDNHGGKTCVNNLIKSGWIQHDRDLIALHPLISEVAIQNCMDSNCNLMLKNVTKNIRLHYHDILREFDAHDEYATLFGGVANKLLVSPLKNNFVIEVLNNLGLAYKGDWDKDYWRTDCSYKYLHHAMIVGKDIYGFDHLYVASLLNNLGCLYKDNGDGNKAMMFFNEALKIRISNFDFAHILVARILFNIGATYKDEKNYEATLKYYQQVLEIYSKLFGTEHIAVAQQYGWISHLFGHMGSYDLSKKFGNQALNIYNNLGVANTCVEHLKAMLADVDHLNNKTASVAVFVPDCCYDDYITFSDEKRIDFGNENFDLLIPDFSYGELDLDDEIDFCDIDF